jgi:Flp pilus assembly protein TadG
MSSHSRPAGDARKAQRAGFPGRFLCDRSGSTAIEFAALALPFSMLVFAILESCIAFAGQEVMANATDDVARQLRTGQVRSITAPDLKAMICARLEVMVSSDCPNQMIVDLQQYATFQDAAAVGFAIVNGEIKPTRNRQVISTDFSVTTGGASSINMLRVFYKWPVMTDFVSKWMANLNDGKTLHFTSITWQNEPFN